MLKEIRIKYVYVKKAKSLNIRMVEYQYLYQHI